MSKLKEEAGVPKGVTLWMAVSGTAIRFEEVWGVVITEDTISFSHKNVSKFDTADAVFQMPQLAGWSFDK